MKKSSLKLAGEWFKKAQPDLDFAGMGLKETNHFGQVCFFCQQAVEKYLKGFLTAFDCNFSKIHQTAILIKKCAGIDKRFGSLLKECKILDRYYIPTRYPVPWQENYTKTDARQALKISERIIDLITTILKTNRRKK